MLSHSTNIGNHRNAGRRDGDPYGVHRGQSEPCNAGRQEWRPLRRNWNGFDLPESLCYPTLAAPLPPSYEEGVLRRRRARIFETFPITYPVGAATLGGPHAVSLVHRKPQLRPTGSNTPALRGHTFFRKRGRGIRMRRFAPPFYKNCAAKRRKTFLPPLGQRGQGGFEPPSFVSRPRRADKFKECAAGATFFAPSS